MKYVPKNVPLNTPSGLRDWLASELRRIAQALATVDNVSLPPLAQPPARFSDGVIVYADGTNWNPGSGAGFYGRQAGAWVKL